MWDVVAKLGDVVAQFGGCGGSMALGCGGSMVVHQAVKPAFLGSFPASLQPAGTCHYSRVGTITAGWPLSGGRCNKYQKIPKIILRKKYSECSLKNINQ